MGDGPETFRSISCWTAGTSLIGRAPSHHLSQSFTWYLRTTLRLAARYPRSPTDPTTPHEPCPCPYPASHSIYGWTRGGVDAASDQTPSRSTPAGRSPCETPVLIPGASRLHQLRRPHRRSTHASGSYRRSDRGTNGDSTNHDTRAGSPTAAPTGAPTATPPPTTALTPTALTAAPVTAKLGRHGEIESGSRASSNFRRSNWGAIGNTNCGVFDDSLYRRPCPPSSNCCRCA